MVSTGCIIVLEIVYQMDFSLLGFLVCSVILGFGEFWGLTLCILLKLLSQLTAMIVGKPFLRHVLNISYPKWALLSFCRYFWSNFLGSLKEKPFRDPWTIKWGVPQSIAYFRTSKLKNIWPGWVRCIEKIVCLLDLRLLCTDRKTYSLEWRWWWCTLWYSLL